MKEVPNPNRRLNGEPDIFIYYFHGTLHYFTKKKLCEQWLPEELKRGEFVPSVPADATLIEVNEPRDGYIRVFNKQNQQWAYKKDGFGKRIWHEGGHTRRLDLGEEVPEGYSLQKPIWMVKRDSINYIIQICNFITRDIGYKYTLSEKEDWERKYQEVLAIEKMELENDNTDEQEDSNDDAVTNGDDDVIENRGEENNYIALEVSVTGEARNDLMVKIKNKYHQYKFLTTMLTAYRRKYKSIILSENFNMDTIDDVLNEAVSKIKIEALKHLSDEKIEGCSLFKKSDEYIMNVKNN